MSEERETSEATGAASVPGRSGATVWLQAVRPFSFTASVTPMLLGAALALYKVRTSAGVEAEWRVLPLILICGLLYHAGANLISDYFDFKHGVDRVGTKGSSGVLVSGTLRPGQIYRAGWLLLGVGSVLGLAFVAMRGGWALALGLIGLLGGYFYCGGPKGYKYFGLGDAMVGLLFGPLMVLGSYFWLTGRMDPAFIFLTALPIGALVIAILHANNTRDIDDDRVAHSHTLAGLVGFERSKAYYTGLLVFAYIATVACVASRVLPLGALLVLLTLKPAVAALGKVRGSTSPADERLAMADVQSAQLHLAFGVTLSVGIVASALLA